MRLVSAGNRAGMEYAYRYCDTDKLYLNVTNRCTNRCRFCVRYQTEELAGAVLWGGNEPDFRALKEAVLRQGDPGAFNEFIWCGFGEPTYRLDLIMQAADWLRSEGAIVRLNTNGHACLIHGRDVLPELSESIDEVSISLNAPDCECYMRVCRPDSGPDLGYEVFWDATVDFLSRCPNFFEHTQASVVGSALSRAEIEASRSFARSLGINQFQVR